MLAGFARVLKSLSIPRAGYHIGLSSLLLLAGAGSVHDAAALNETRTLSFHHTHSSEDLTVTFKRNGRYDEAALKQLNHFLRDWRSQEQTTMDRHLFDILWEVYRDVDARQPINIVSAYRSPATNAMLRRRSKHTGVARFSQHMLGHAMDFFIPGVPLEKIRFAGLRLQRGGVGFYPKSGSPFVHLDTGHVRHWPRMTHDQLARVFPNGRTVHIPSDGNPLPGYQLAMADIEKRGQNADEDGAVNSKPSNFLLALFRGKSADEDDEPDGAPAARPANQTTVASAAPAASADPVPLPRAKPPAAFRLASADVLTVPAAQPTTKQAASGKPQTPADIINARGFWDEIPSAPKQATPQQVIAAISARQALAKADPQPTSSISDTFQALAYAPPPAKDVRRARIVAATASIPPVRRAAPARNPMAVGGVTTVVAKGAQGQGTVVSTSRRLAPAATRDSDVWMRAMILAPSASRTMSATALGDQDMTLMQVYFEKPDRAITMTFSDNPQMGIVCNRFTGSAVASLTTTALAN
ncbi:protein of unknown function DUF882 [Nitrobacter hamburgensis X14]|uniref:Murein endopeptidase K n=1 Tax=Nitrobacter hamburgensis (strain DSM 10229 / NCIMB 13809 / X14) TaxID=323097 RepID=Q1QNZ7_NITHX|nr:DUF882 domain-containing protein [Nitrobacter hamburgensis]ABE62050.1 protein of unknown function DUF882 [Nitrobacter hamburgensis X14]